MAYRFDDDLEFLGKLQSKDLDDLVYCLIHDTDGKERLTEELTSNDLYKRYAPDHNKYWEDIAGEIQCFGANTFATLFRRGKGVKYNEVLTDVCDKLKVNYNKNSSTEMIENNLLLKILQDALEKMTPEDIKSLGKELGINTTSLDKQAALATCQTIFKMGGFKSYQLTLIIANAIMKALFGREKVSLAEARLLRNEEKKALKSGIDTVAEKKAALKKVEEEGRTFGMISEEWLNFWKNDKDDKTIKSTIGRLEKHILPYIGKKPYSSLDFSDLKSVCFIPAKSEHREMANRVATIICQICRFAKINGYHKYNIAEDLTVLFPKPKKDVNFEGFPAITDRDGVAEMLRKIDKFVNAGRCSC